MVRNRREQATRVRVLGVAEHLLDATAFDDAPRVHHGHPVRQTRNDREVMGDVEHRHVPLGLQARELVEDPALADDVQSSRWLIQHNDRWVTGKCHRDTDALLLAA